MSDHINPEPPAEDQTDVDANPLPYDITNPSAAGEEFADGVLGRVPGLDS